MKLRSLVIALALAAACSGLAAQPAARPYDKQIAVSTMRENLSRVGLVKEAIAKADWPAVAEHFYAYAQASVLMASMVPPVGSRETWLATWSVFQYEAYRGVGAAGLRDADAATAALNSLLAANKKGHGEFKR